MAESTGSVTYIWQLPQQAGILLPVKKRAAESASVFVFIISISHNQFMHIISHNTLNVHKS